MDLLILILYLGGFFFFLVGTMGLVRLPDALSRLHATSLTDTMGSTLILAGLVLKLLPQAAALKVVLIWLIILVVNPTTAHLVGKYAWYKEQEQTEERGRSL